MTFSIAHSAVAHPLTGIVVDDKGQVYFTHGRVGIWKLDTEGKLALVDGPAYHHMIADPKGAFVNQRWPHFPDGVIEAVGKDPVLLCASSFPITIAADGAL